MKKSMVSCFGLGAAMALALLFIGCDTTGDGSGSTVAETGKAITLFKIGDVEGDIDEEAHAISVVLPASQTNFDIAIEVSPGARVAQTALENAAGLSVYTVTAGNGDTQAYDVTTTRLGASGVVISLPSQPVIQITSASPHWPNQMGRVITNGKNQATLEVSDTTCDSYRWYVDGEQVRFFARNDPSPRTPSFQITGGNFSAGKHVLVLVAVKNGVPYTAEQIFMVSEG